MESDDAATFSAGKGWGDERSNLVKEVYDLDEWAEDLSDDPILAAQLAEDATFDD